MQQVEERYTCEGIAAVQKTGVSFIPICSFSSLSSFFSSGMVGYANRYTTSSMV